MALPGVTNTNKSKAGGTEVFCLKCNKGDVLISNQCRMSFVEILEGMRRGDLNATTSEKTIIQCDRDVCSRTDAKKEDRNEENGSHRCDTTGGVEELPGNGLDISRWLREP